MLKSALVALSLLALARSNLIAYMPTCAVQEIKTNIDYTLANFGHILYGRTIVGELIIPADAEFCGTDNMESFGAGGDDIKKFVLIKRGSCKFTKKILNAQRRGADMVIIYDNEVTKDPMVVMANDGHGHLIDIPSIFISNLDGEKMIKTFKKCSNSSIFKMTFEVFVTKEAHVTFFLDASNRETFVTIRDFFRDYYGVIKKYINVDLKYKLNRNCGMEECDSEDCVLDKKEFCLPEKKTMSGKMIEGKQITNEHLREFFLFEQMKEKKKIENWVSYMNDFDDKLCLEELDVKECSYTVMSSYAKRESIESKIVQTYNNATLAKPNVLEDFVTEKFNHDILFFPEVSINKRNFYGLFRAPDIFEMICKSLESPPRECHSFLKNDRKETFGPDDRSGLFMVIVKILALMLVTFLLALLIYTRIIKREINQQMSVEVNKMVEHYVAMTEQKSRSAVM